jgi:hypothetical protein
MPVHGLRDKSDRVLTVRTVWEMADANTPPRHRTDRHDAVVVRGE